MDSDCTDNVYDSSVKYHDSSNDPIEFENAKGEVISTVTWYGFLINHKLKKNTVQYRDHMQDHIDHLIECYERELKMHKRTIKSLTVSRTMLRTLDKKWYQFWK